MNPTVLRADEYRSEAATIYRPDIPLVHRAILAEIERLTDRFADAVEAKDGMAAMEAADQVSRLRAILASPGFQRLTPLPEGPSHDSR